MRIQSLIIAMLAVSGSAAAQCPQLIWADEFDGTSLDIDNWNHQVGDGCDIGLCDWGNNELQYYKAENTEVGEGTLKIIAKRENVENKVYTSSRLNTKGHSEWTYGRFEARIKLPTGKGIWPAFWMLSSDEPYGSWPQSGEIDIMELIGSEPATAHGTLHFGALPPGNRSVSESYILNDGIFNDAFHTFAIEWEEKKISWYVDDYLYASKTNLSLGGSMWPFDHDFHILLNLAVGGNWPGFPDGSTQFPQTMEVDYVRVYDGFMPNISGDRSVENQAQGIRYELNSIAPGASIVWQVPDDAEIVEGQGTSSITVNFKDGSGDVLAIYTDDCRTDTLTVSVKISPAFESELSLENFDDPANIEFNFASGAFSDEVANPGASEINDSPLCGKYDRNVAETFDVLIYDVDILTDVAPYLTDDKRFFIDVYTDAPVGTTILMQLENDTRSQPQNFPSGRHSRFEARTSIQGAWERLHLTLLDQPDPNTPNTAIDQIVFLFASNTSSSNTFYFDNFDSYAPAKVVPTREQNSHRLTLYPNPTSDYLIIKNARRGKPDTALIYHIGGRLEQQIPLPPTDLGEQKINISTLPAGAYFVALLDHEGHRQVVRFVKG